MTQNPNYYNLSNVTHRHLSEHLSQLVEDTLSDLVNSKCITVEDEMDVSALNLGMIAAYYNISCAYNRHGMLPLAECFVDVTVEVFSLSLKGTTKLKGLLEIVSSSAEFESIPIRRHEDGMLRRIYDRVPVKLDEKKVNYDSPAFKTFLLLQAHFSRLQLPPDLVSDQALVLDKVLNLLSACVDVMSSNAYLNALGAMDMSQMCVQAIWETDSPLRQIPHFESDVCTIFFLPSSPSHNNISKTIARFKAAHIDTVYDVLEMEDDARIKLLDMDRKQLYVEFFVACKSLTRL